jgi:LEA14-like dessication related protein
MRYKIVCIFALISVFFLTSCQVKEITVGDIKGLNITAMNSNYIDLGIMIPINNPNNFGFKLVKADISIEMNGVVLGKINKLKKVKIPANSNEVHTFELRVSMDDLKSGGLAFLGSLLSNKAKVDMKGYIKARSFLISKKVDIDYNKSVKLFKNLK